MLFLLVRWQPSKVNQPPFTVSDGIALFWGTVRDFLKGFAERLPYIIVGVLIYILFLILSKLLKKGINNIARRSNSINDTLAS
ncbi:MAG: hypothetical protein H7319_15485 [Spirosoma sp.]|nr:hypothetical protein [Spirosoma sp.]